MEELEMRQRNHVFFLDPMLLLWEAKVYTQTVADGYVVQKEQPKHDGHVVVIERAIIQDTRCRSNDSN